MELIVECECGLTWDMDAEPTPWGCEEEVWRLWADGEPGAWVDSEGDPAIPTKYKEEK